MPQIYRQRVNAKDIPIFAHTMDMELEPLKRYDGAHVSTILKFIGAKTKIMKDYSAVQEDRAVAEHNTPETSEVFRMNFMMMMGLAWESWLFRRLPGVQWQPGEVVLDSIGMNADGVNLDGQWDMPNSTSRGITTNWLEECKVTWQSVNNPEVPGWYRLCQIMAYCHGFGLTRAKLWIYHVRGDYKMDFGPQVFVYWIEFTEEELLNNWRMILNGKKEMETELCQPN